MNSYNGKTQEDLRTMVDELCELDTGLTQWEADFVDSVSRWDGDYTEKQANTIIKIWQKRVEDASSVD